MGMGLKVYFDHQVQMILCGAYSLLGSFSHKVVVVVASDDHRNASQTCSLRRTTYYPLHGTTFQIIAFL